MASWDFIHTGAIFSPGHFGSGEILLDNVECSGDETRLLDCAANEVGEENCSHFEDAGVICEDARKWTYSYS